MSAGSAHKSFTISYPHRIALFAMCRIYDFSRLLAHTVYAFHDACSDLIIRYPR